MLSTSEDTLWVAAPAAGTPTGNSEAEGAERGKYVVGPQGRRRPGTGREMGTSGGTGLWELGKARPELCSPCFCQESGEAQLSSVIEGRITE